MGYITEIKITVDLNNTPKCKKELPQQEYITLCGSTKFKTVFEEINKQLTLQGNVVYSLAIFSHIDGVVLNDEEIETLHSVHRCKILKSKSIFVIDVDNYIGQNTEKEIKFAKDNGMNIYYFSDYFSELLTFEKWYEKNEESINIELVENGASREMDFDVEKEFDKRYVNYVINF